MKYWEVRPYAVTVEAENEHDAVTAAMTVIYEAMVNDDLSCEVEEVVLGPPIIGQVPPP